MGIKVVPQVIFVCVCSHWHLFTVFSRLTQFGRNNELYAVKPLTNKASDPVQCMRTMPHVKNTWLSSSAAKHSEEKVGNKWFHGCLFKLCFSVSIKLVFDSFSPWQNTLYPSIYNYPVHLQRSLCRHVVLNLLWWFHDTAIIATVPNCLHRIPVSQLNYQQLMLKARWCFVIYQ